MRPPFLLLLLAACTTAPARPQPPGRLDLCDPRRTCPPGLGVCVRCDETGDPRWAWSDAAGEAGALWPLPDPDCKTTTFDDHGRPLEIHDHGLTIQLDYDQAGRPRRRRDHCEDCGRPDIDWLVAWRHEGDLLVAEVPDTGLTMAWDARGRLVRDNHRTLTYREDGLRLAVVKGDVEERFEYDEAGRCTGSTSYLDGVPRGQTVRTWDAHGHLLLHTVVRDGEEEYRAEHTWTHDAKGRPVALELGPYRPAHFEWQRDAQGRVLRMVGPDYERTTAYDESGVIIEQGGADTSCLARFWPALTSP